VRRQLVKQNENSKVTSGKKTSTVISEESIKNKMIVEEKLKVLQMKFEKFQRNGKFGGSQFVDEV